MYILYKSEHRIMILEKINENTFTFFCKVIKIVKSAFNEFEDMQEGNTYTLSLCYVIGKYDTLEELNEEMYLMLL